MSRAAKLALGACIAALFVGAGASASSDYSAAIAGASAGAAAGSAAGGYQPAVHGMPPEVTATELDDWLDPRTHSTAALRTGCGQDVEIHLSRTGAFAYLDVTVSNSSGFTVTLAKDAVQVRFESGLVRTLKPTWPGDTPLRSGWSNHYTFLFPAKKDFEGQNSLVVTLAFLSGASTCALDAEMQRDVRVPTDQRTYVAYDTLELFLSVGARFAAMGPLAHARDDAGVALDLGFGGFPSVNLGYFIDISLQSSGSPAGGPLADEFGAKAPRADTGGFYAGAAFRLYPLTWLETSLRPSVGLYFFDLTNPSDSNDTHESVAFAVRTKLRGLIRIAQLGDGSRMWLGPELVHLAIPHLTHGGTNLSGQDFEALLGWSWGG